MKLSSFSDYQHKHTGEVFYVTEFDAEHVSLKMRDYDLLPSDRKVYKYTRQLFFAVFIEYKP